MTSSPQRGASPDAVLSAVLRIGRRTVGEIEQDPRWPSYCRSDPAAEALLAKGRAAFASEGALVSLDAADAGSLVDELIRVLTLMRRGN